MHLGIYFFQLQNDEIVWQSSQVTVCIDMDSMESMEIPDDIRTGLENHSTGAQYE